MPCSTAWPAGSVLIVWTGDSAPFAALRSNTPIVQNISVIT